MAAVPPLEMACQVGGGCAPTLEMVRSWVECNAALEGYVAEVNRILNVDFRGSVLEVDFRGRP